MDYEKICKGAIERFGFRRQVEKAEEEMAELISALHHFKDGRATMDDVVTEIADVTIMMLQLAMIFGKEEVDDEVVYKLKRLEDRL